MAEKSTLDAILDRELAGPVTASSGGDFSNIVSQASNSYGVPVELINAVIAKESSGNPTARSGAGASGLMQIMPNTATELGITDVNDPKQNINGGTKYLKKLYDQFGKWDLALAAYNAGPGNVNKYKGIPPFKETQNYVKDVMKNSGGAPSGGSSLDDILSQNGVAAEPPMSQESLDARPKIDASNTYDAQKILTGLIDPRENTGTKALAVTSGVIGRPFAGPPTVLDAVEFFSPGVKEKLLPRSSGGLKSVSHPFEEAEKEEPIAAGLGQILGLGAPSVGAKVGSKIASSVGPKVLNRFLKAKTPEIAPYVQEHIGVVKNIDEFITKNESVITNNVKKLQKTLDAVPKIGNNLVQLPKNMNSTDILTAAEHLDKIRDVEGAAEFLKIAKRAKYQGNKLTVGDLNRVKQHFQGLSYGKSGPLGSDQAGVYRDWATEMRSNIEKAFGVAGKTGKESVELGNKVAKMNQDIASGFKTKSLLKATQERAISSGGISNLDLAATFLTGGAYAPIAVANKVSKTSLGATMANTGGKKISDLLNLLVPQAVKKIP